MGFLFAALLATLNQAPAHAVPTQALAGPFASLVDYCRQVGDGAACDPDQSGLLGGPSSVDDATNGVRGARVFVTKTTDGNRCNLGVATEQGWFVLPGVAVCSSKGTYHTWTRSSQLALLDVVPGGSLELVLKLVEFGEGTDYADGGDAWVDDFTREKMIVCGVGNLGVPSCTAPILLGFRDNRSELHDDKGTHQYAQGLLDVALKNGALVGAKTDSKMSDDQQKLVGSHPLFFP